jgi:hypothetical protein
VKVTEDLLGGRNGATSLDMREGVGTSGSDY